MLVLKRQEGQWVEIIHRSGDVIRVRVYDIHADGDGPSRANLAFDDSARNFEVRRPERKLLTPVNTPGPEADAGFEPAAAAGMTTLPPHWTIGQFRPEADDGQPDPGDFAVS
jgi:hypothetical protein